MSDLIERLHARADESDRLVAHMPNGSAELCREAATALSEAKAENERLTRERDEAVRVATNVSRALTSLTPGGSEYHSHSRILDAYFADTEACVAVVRERYASGHKAKLELVGARAALNPKGGDNGEG